MPRPVVCSAGLAIIILLVSSCALPPRVNDPDDATYNPNFPIKRRLVSVPTEHEGKKAVYATAESSMFVDRWMPPGPAYAQILKAVENKMPGYERLKARYLDVAAEHSIKSMIDEGLTGLLLTVYFARDAATEFSEGTHIVHYADGSSSLDQGVRLNMSGDPDRRKVRRSYADRPLKVSREQRTPDHRYLQMMIMLPKEDGDKEVVKIEAVGTGMPTVSQAE